MAEGLRPVSILGVGFAWLGLAVRRWPTALIVALGPLGVIAILWALVVVGPLQRSDISPPAVMVIVGALALLVLGVGQLLVCRALLGGTRLRTVAGGWTSDLGRILVVTVVWIAVIFALQTAAAFGLDQTGLLHSSGLYNGLSYALGVPLLALPLLWLGLTASAAFHMRRWLLIVRPPPWPDLWRILAGWALVCAQGAAMWWGAGRGIRWLAASEAPGLGPSLRSVLTTALFGGPLGLTVLLLAAGGAQAWRQSLGRADEDPMAVFD